MVDQKLIDDPFEFLEQISEIGKMTKEIPVTENFKVKVSTLNSDDDSAILANTDNAKGTEFFTRFRQETLSFAIIAINDKPLDFYEKIEDEKERKIKKDEAIAKKLNIIKKWSDDVLNYVYSQYTEMLEENEKKLIEMGIVKENEKGLKIISEDKEELKKEKEEEEVFETEEDKLEAKAEEQLEVE
jgi:hypothetical protein